MARANIYGCFPQNCQEGNILAGVAVPIFETALLKLWPHHLVFTELQHSQDGALGPDEADIEVAERKSVIIDKCSRVV